MKAIFSLLWLNESLAIGKFGSQLLCFELDIPHTFPCSAVIANSLFCCPFVHRWETSILWNFPLGIVATWLFPAAQQHLTDKCQMHHEHQLKQSHPALPLCSLVNFGINQLQIQLLTTSPGFHSSPDHPNSHLLMFSLAMALGKHKQILTAFFSTTTALPGDKHTTVRLWRLPQTASLFNTSFWQTSLWYKVGQ